MYVCIHEVSIQLKVEHLSFVSEVFCFCPHKSINQSLPLSAFLPHRLLQWLGNGFIHLLIGLVGEQRKRNTPACPLLLHLQVVIQLIYFISYFNVIELLIKFPGNVNLTLLWISIGFSVSFLFVTQHSAPLLILFLLYAMMQVPHICAITRLSGADSYLSCSSRHLLMVPTPLLLICPRPLNLSSFLCIWLALAMGSYSLHIMEVCKWELVMGWPAQTLSALCPHVRQAGTSLAYVAWYEPDNDKPSGCRQTQRELLN